MRRELRELRRGAARHGAEELGVAEVGARQGPGDASAKPPNSRGHSHFHSFQGSFFPENYQNPRGNSWLFEKNDA